MHLPPICLSYPSGQGKFLAGTGEGGEGSLVCAGVEVTNKIEVEDAMPIAEVATEIYLLVPQSGYWHKKPCPQKRSACQRLVFPAVNRGTLHA
jgi:hypothetical protein